MKAVLYKRVSTDEQAFGFSLLDQDKRLTEYCQKTGIQIAGSFHDDCTGKNFNRPGFTQLLSFIKSKTHKIDQIIFTKWSRFSRNTSDSYQMIKQIRALGIEVQAIDEPIDFSIPQNKIMLAIYLATPEIDNDMRADATIRGMRRSVKEGRYCNRAPYGYENSSDPNKKPLLIIDTDIADLIRQAFQMYATGTNTQLQIRQWLYEHGFKVSRNRFSRMLRDPIYIGKLHLKAWKDEPDQLITGIHEPIISEATFYRVQELLTGKSKHLPPRKTKMRDEFPLRGFLYCSCGGKMTASLSKGKGGYYGYYHCHYPCNTRYKAVEVNQGFEKFLTGIKINDEIIEIFQLYVMEEMKDDGSELLRLKKQAEGQADRIKFVQDKFADGQLQFNDFLSMKSRYESALFELNQKITNIEKDKSAIRDNFNSAMQLLTNISGFYRDASTEVKRDIISSITSGVIYFEDKKCRTPQINELIRLLGTFEGDMHRLVALTGLNVEPSKLQIDCKRLADTYKLVA